MIGRKVIKVFAWLFAIMGLIKLPSIIKTLYLEQPELIGKNYIPVDFFTFDMLMLYYFLILFSCLSITSILVIRKRPKSYYQLLLVLFFCLVTKIGIAFYYNHYRYIINHKLLDLSVDILLYGIPAFFLIRELRLVDQIPNYLKSQP